MVNYINIQKTEADIVVEPVDLQSTKDWIQIDFADFDTSLLTPMILGARQTIEKFTNLALVENDVEVDFEVTCEADRIFLPYTFKVDVSTLVVKDYLGNIIDPLNYKVRGNVLVFLGGFMGEYNVKYSISVDSVPQPLKEAIKMEVAERFANRGENQAMRANYDSPSLGISEAAKAKALPYQMTWL